MIMISMTDNINFTHACHTCWSSEHGSYRHQSAFTMDSVLSSIDRRCRVDKSCLHILIVIYTLCSNGVPSAIYVELQASLCVTKATLKHAVTEVPSLTPHIHACTRTRNLFFYTSNLPTTIRDWRLFEYRSQYYDQGLPTSTAVQAVSARKPWIFSRHPAKRTSFY